MKQKIIVLKFGGSVVTQKGREQVYIRKQLLTSIAKEIKRSFNGKNFQLILIHGAGSAGHQLAHKYGLKNGAGKDIKKMERFYCFAIVKSEIKHTNFRYFN